MIQFDSYFSKGLVQPPPSRFRRCKNNLSRFKWSHFTQTAFAPLRLDALSVHTPPAGLGIELFRERDGPRRWDQIMSKPLEFGSNSYYTHPVYEHGWQAGKSHKVTNILIGDTSSFMVVYPLSLVCFGVYLSLEVPPKIVENTITRINLPFPNRTLRYSSPKLT